MYNKGNDCKKIFTAKRQVASVERIWHNSSQHSVVRICIDKLEDYDFYGRLESGLLGVFPFQGAIELLRYLYRFYNKIGFPESTFQFRSFGSGCPQPKKTIPEPLLENEPRQWEEEPGLMATFLLQMIFRQHATCQGWILWVEQDKRYEFRSTLELFRLMESILGKNNVTEQKLDAL